jgi:membrane protein YdbS with pleckstrin-like domain
MVSNDIFYVQGLWILGSVFMLLGAVIAGNIEWVEGTTTWSFGISVLIAFAFFLVAGLCWISSAVNARKEER